jgi:Cu2+-exporting ATPase
MATHSRHPYSRALAAASAAIASSLDAGAVVEIPGAGLEARIGTHLYRLGRASWALSQSDDNAADSANVVLSRDGQSLARFAFEDRLRDGAHATITELTEQGFAVEVLSGDRDAAVRRIAGDLGAQHLSEVTPAGKVARVNEIESSGRRVLMVGDGLNDAPALAAAHASMAPASAADVGRNAADLVFLHESLRAVPEAIGIARNAARLVQQNLALAIGYNVIAVPIAVLGYVTPLIAAVAMSSSSIVVIANALRLRGVKRDRRATRAIAKAIAAQPAMGKSA